MKLQHLYRISAWLRFLWKSKNEHGVHSPFVFSLVTKCFYDRRKYPEYELLAEYRNKLVANLETIYVTDFGAGSTVFKSNTRRIADIAKNAGISKKRAELLFRVVQYFQPEDILELGTSLGLATSALSLGNPNSKIITLEGCPETAGAAITALKDAGLDNVEIHVGEFSALLSQFSVSVSSLSFQSQFSVSPTQPLSPSATQLLYFDGNHQKDATLNYFQQLLPTAGNDAVWIFDDIHWSRGMEEAWEAIKQSPNVTVTIDTFQWGFVFFRKEQAKENFTIRV